MCRKIVTGIGLLAVGSYLWMGTSVGSYARTGVTEVKSYFQGQVPIEFEIQRAKQLVSELVPDIHRSMKSIAEEEVKIARLRSEIAVVEKNIESEKVALLALRQQASLGLTAYKIGSETYSAQQLQNELNRRFNSFKRADTALTAKKEILESRQAALVSAREKYDGLIDAKQQLESEVAALEARHTMLEAKKVANRFAVDDTDLSRVRQLIDGINDRLTVEAKLSEEQGNLQKRIPIEELPPVNLGEQIDQYFGKEAAPSTGTAL